MSILSVLILFTVASGFGLSNSILLRSASQSSCPSNKTITFVTEPIPQSFNYLNPSGDSTFYLGSIEYLTLTPFPLEPNGSLDWSESLTNWITSNSNYTQWTFHIRPGVTWSNGTAVEASDIATWLTPAYALNPQYDFVGAHTEVTGVRVVNSDTAVINLNVSDAQLPNRLSEYYYSPLVSPTDVAKGANSSLFGTGIARRSLVHLQLFVRFN